MCLLPDHGGVLSLGGTSSDLMSAPFGWVPTIKGFGYLIELKQIEVGNSSIGMMARPIIIDSGTNVLLLSSGHFRSIYSHFQKLLCPSFPVPGVCGDTNLFTGQCYKYSASQISQFPNVSLVLDGTTLTIQGQDYLISNNNGSDIYCLGITSSGTVDGLNIIGDVVMQNYYTAFDNAKNRVGWAPVNSANCQKYSKDLL